MGEEGFISGYSSSTQIVVLRNYLVKIVHFLG